MGHLFMFLTCRDLLQYNKKGLISIKFKIKICFRKNCATEVLKIHLHLFHRNMKLVCRYNIIPVDSLKCLGWINEYVPLSKAFPQWDVAHASGWILCRFLESQQIYKNIAIKERSWIVQLKTQALTSIAER